MAFVWLLNALDGIGSGEEGIVILTMNYQDKLDEALIRPGRVDFEAYLGHMSQKSAEEIFLRMFEPGLLESGHAHFERSDAEGPGESATAERLQSLPYTLRMRLRRAA